MRFCFAGQPGNALVHKAVGLLCWQAFKNNKSQIFSDMQVCTDLLDGTVQHIQQLFTIHGVNKRERLVVEVDAAPIGSYLKWDRDEKMTGLIQDGAPIQPE
jgi:hypothetical protein